MTDVMMANLDKASERNDFLTLFAEYNDGMVSPDYANGGSLAPNLIEEILKRPNIVIFLAYKNEKPAGFAVVIEAFSTFSVLPIFNIHDIGVSGDFRKQGVGKALMAAVQKEAKIRNCCKLTLEVHEHNTNACNLYEAMGYSSLTGENTTERTFFMVKHL